MALLYVIIGFVHFFKPTQFVAIIPPWLPQPLLLVYISGACELIFALLLLPPKTRSFAAYSLILLLVAVFPANIQMMLIYKQQHNPDLWLAILRLPLQLVLIWWAWTNRR